MNKKYKVAIVGATGAVGAELLKLLFKRNFPMESLTLLASSRSAGKEIKFEDKTFVVEEAKPECFSRFDIAIFSAGGTPSKQLVPECAKRGCIAIDNSSAFRMDPEVPLIVPEVNPHALKGHKNIIANPNCTTAISLMALCPLHREFGLKRFFAATYQAVSGTGVAAMAELESQMKAIAEGRKPEVSVYPYQIAYNVIPHVDVFLDNGYTKEELKMLNETRKILEVPTVLNSTTCVRVPVMRAHSVAINAEFEKPVSVERAREVIAAFPGAELVDDVDNKIYPVPLNFQCKEKCGVGRIRKDLAFENGLSFWVAGDQLWKGAALNAVQIAELIASEDAKK